MNAQAKKSPFADFPTRLASEIQRVFSGSQRALAQQSGISPQAINTYLNVEELRIPKSIELYQIARALGVSMEYLLTGQYPEGGGGMVMEAPPAQLPPEIRRAIHELNEVAKKF